MTQQMQLTYNYSDKHAISVHDTIWQIALH